MIPLTELPQFTSIFEDYLVSETKNDLEDVDGIKNDSEGYYEVSQFTDIDEGVDIEHTIECKRFVSLSLPLPLPSHLSARGMRFKEVIRNKERKKDRLQCERCKCKKCKTLQSVQLQLVQEEVKTQTISTSWVKQSRTFLDQIKHLFKRNVKEEIVTKSWADLRVSNITPK